MFEEIDTIVQTAIEEKVFPGCVIGVVTRSGERHIFPYGRYSYGSDAPGMETESIFDVASITKSIPTAAIALKALEEKQCTLTTPVITWIPELHTDFRELITVKHLLTHSIDFDLRLSSMKRNSSREILQAIFNAKIKNVPGSCFSYCNTTSILLGIVVQRLYNKPIDTLGDDYFFQPLAMRKSCFNPRPEIRNTIVPAEIDPWRGRIIQGEVHDESAWILSSIMVPGSAGLFSTVPDLLVFIEMLLHNGTLNSRRIFLPETVEIMSSNHIPGQASCTGLGWELNQSRFMGSLCSERTIGKTGFTGCSIIADLIRGIGVVFLSNSIFPKRKKDHGSINAVRVRIHDSIFKTVSYQ